MGAQLNRPVNSISPLQVPQASSLQVYKYSTVQYTRSETKRTPCRSKRPQKSPSAVSSRYLMRLTAHGPAEDVRHHRCLRSEVATVQSSCTIFLSTNDCGSDIAKDCDIARHLRPGLKNILPFCGRWRFFFPSSLLPVLQDQPRLIREDSL